MFDESHFIIEQIPHNKDILGIEELEKNAISRITLKEEAIEWIKEIYCFEKTEVDKWTDDFLGRETIYSEEAKQGIINFIKHFFNITEEDLNE